MFFCSHKDLLGEPKKGIHSFRIKISTYDFAIVDILLTIIVAIVISYKYNYNFFTTLMYMIILGIIVHYLFCVPTTLNNILFR